MYRILFCKLEEKRLHITLKIKKILILNVKFCSPIKMEETFEKFMSIVFYASLNKFQQQLFSIDKKTFEQILKKTDVNGDTLLHIACNKYREGNKTKEEEKIITILVEKGANIYVKNLKEETPLDYVDPKMRGIMRGNF